jgi:DHA1 family multidrug resistance protein-like MFS transporter
MQYPEERDTSVWPEYLKTEPEAKEEEEASTPVTENENPEDLETFGLYTVMSQCSNRSRRMSTVSTLGGGRNNSLQTNQSLVISWCGPNDPEVSFPFHDAQKMAY